VNHHPSDPCEEEHLATLLASISQGVYLLGPDGRVTLFNQRLCELLDLPSEFFAGRPTLEEINALQMSRGDFGQDATLVDAKARTYVLAGGKAPLPTTYLRSTLAGRTLEIKTQPLPHGGMVRTFADVTDYVQAQAARQRLNQLLNETQILGAMGGWEIDLANQQVTWTEGVYRIFDTSPEVFVPTLAAMRQLTTPQSLALLEATRDDSGLEPAEHELEVEMVTLTGRHIWVLSRGSNLWANRCIVKRTAIVQDITRRKLAELALRDSEARWKLALESTGDGLWDLNLQTGDEYLSPNLLRMYGYREDDLEFRLEQLDALTHPEDVVQMQLDRKQHIDGLTPTYQNEHRVRCQDGQWKWVLSRGMIITRDANGQPLRMIGTHTDITQRKHNEALVWQQAHFDTLTGLPNRRMMRERLAQEIKKCRRDDRQLAVLFLDLDHFKEVNDTLGHHQGDVLLTEAAQRITHCLREVDTVSRMGGDEFTVIVTELQAADSLEGILNKLLTALGGVFQLGTEQVFVSASIGVTLYPTDATDIDGLLKNADQALYVAKGEGRNRYHFFTPALQEATRRRVSLTQDLRLALAAQQFRVVYQPIVELATGSIHKAEVLVRWQHPSLGLISPAEFIPVAESSGLIVPLGEWVFRQAADQVQVWRAKLHPDFQISVNKSPVQFENPNPAHASWIAQLEERGLTGDSIAVEITEGLLLSNSQGVTQQLMNLNADGIGVSLDDFGTGYSSLAYLQKFDIDFIKIDQSFVQQLGVDSTDLALCQAIIVMAHALGMKVIAEGIETEQQRSLLTAAGCDYGQGYLFSKPVPAADFESVRQALMPTETPSDWSI
jgi:diguanylate cyclase (GGDEF)-like protein/PAS domain S-box-containing protein